VCVHVAGLYADLNYGYGVATWDLAITPLFLDNVFKQYDAANTNDNCVVWMWHAPRDTSLVLAAYEARGYVQPIEFYWHKTGHNVAGPKSALTSSVETCMIGYKKNRNDVAWNCSDDPTERHNFIDYKGVTKMARDDTNNIINPSEKPPYVVCEIIRTNCNRGDTIVIVGPGSGGDIMGAVLAGINVVAVEKDPYQFKSLQAHLTKLAAEEQEALDKGKIPRGKSSSAPTTAKGSSSSSSVSMDAHVADVDAACRECKLEFKDEPKAECYFCNYWHHVDCMTVNHASRYTIKYQCNVCAPTEDEEEENNSLAVSQTYDQ
jgi:hypothetical protein